MASRGDQGGWRGGRGGRGGGGGGAHRGGGHRGGGRGSWDRGSSRGEGSQGRSGSWERGSRLKPPPAQNEDTVGFVSKGDKTLLRHSAQERYYKEIVDRYLTFCEDKGPDLKAAFLSFVMPENTSDGPAIKGLSSNNAKLSSLILSMRKLREAIIATKRTDQFAVGAFMFCIRAAILIKHSDSYFPALGHLLYDMHTVHPLSASDIQEFAGYYVLHHACVLNDCAQAYVLKREFCVEDIRISDILRALVHQNYWLFRNTMKSISLYKCRLAEASEERMRTHTLKCFGKSYFTLQRSYIEKMVGISWGKLLEEYRVGWRLEDDGELVTIRVAKKAAAAPAS